MARRSVAILGSTVALATAATLALVALPASRAAGSSPGTAPAGVPSAAGDTILTATSHGGSYAPTYTGNGYLGIRVPATGEGYAGGDVPSQAELAGFYAQPPGDVQQRANIPTWSTLVYSDGGQNYTAESSSVSGWRQKVDLHTGIITTYSRWTAPNGHVTDLRYDVFTDRAKAHVGTVRLQLTPHWSGTAAVTDLIDGTPATLTSPTAAGREPADKLIWQRVRTQGTNLVAGIASRLALSGGSGTLTAVTRPGINSIGQRLGLPVSAGHTYTVTKYVGVASSTDTDAKAQAPDIAARQAAAGAESLGYARLLQENAAAWAALWRGRIDVLGNRTLATEVNASEFALWSSTRAGLDWSISPAGLSSNGYDGHIFWDAETWMYPSLLAQHPDLAAGMNAYRFQRLGAAKTHAQQTGYAGARFPWESALDGTEQIPPPVSINSEGLYEQHLTADIALAQWQYYLATGDKGWLAQQGWPVISAAATFWASRVTRDAAGSYHINHVTGPDEENPDVNDEAFTNVGAATTLRLATQAAAILGKSAPASWLTIASKLVVPVNSAGIHPEFAGYQSQLVKQADVTMLQYPWQQPMSASVAQNDLNFYVPRSDPGGPSMDDAINSIDTAALGTPGCASYVFTQRSIEPFIRDAFDQFSETRTGGAFTFTTGTGGFLQEFLYGYSGMRWSANGLTIDPSLNSQLGGVVLHDVSWHGRSLTVAIGPSTTSLTLDHGASMPVTVRGVTHTVTSGAPLTVSTRRPDLTPTADVVRCQTPAATSAQRGADPLAAVDGSPATDWQPTTLPATLTVPLHSTQTISHVSLEWGRAWPPAPAPNVPPPPGPVKTLRPTAYSVLTSADGTHWHTVATVKKASGIRDVLRFPATATRYVRVQLSTTASAETADQPMLEELMATP